MSRSNVDICNSALQKVGAAPISSLSEDSVRARACNMAFDTTRRALLCKYDWNFARKRVTLAPDVCAPSFGYLYSFTPPSDFIQAILPNKRAHPVDWVFEGGKILSNMGSSLDLCYTADITAASNWPPLFYSALISALATEVCMILTEDLEKKQLLIAQLGGDIAEAKRQNAILKPKPKSAIENWLVWRLT